MGFINYFFIIMLLSSGLIFGMENSGNQVDTNSMTTMGFWEDAEPFAGKWVAYETKSGDFGAQKGYRIDSALNLLFGYVTTKAHDWTGYKTTVDETGYELCPLVKKGAVALGYPLIDSRLTDDYFESVLSLRLATAQEIKILLGAVESDNGRSIMNETVLRARLHAALKNAQQ